MVERSQLHTIYGITPYIYIAPKRTKVTYGNRIQDGASAGLEVMGMGHEGCWGWCLPATFCFFLLTFCSWFKWICSLCNNSLTCTPKLCTFFGVKNTNVKTRLISLLRCTCTHYLFQILSLYSNNIWLCSCDSPFLLLCANNMHTKNLSRNLKFPKC